MRQHHVIYPFIYLKIQAANLRAHILTDLNDENHKVNTKKFFTYCMFTSDPTYLQSLKKASGLQCDDR